MKILVFAGLGILLNEAAQARITDAPHNEASGIFCADCHPYSLWWELSPFDVNDTGYGQEMDGLCAGCHYPGSNMADGCGHSSIAMAEMHNTSLGDWETHCLDCHDPHFQKQLDWRTNFSESLYLVVGTIGDAASFIYSNSTTTFDYSIEPSDMGSVQAGWDSPVEWPQKNSNPLERGLILVIDPALAENSYEVIAADDFTISVNGTLGQADENKIFGLIYGQFVKSLITPPAADNREVRFFNPYQSENGFVDSQTPVMGLCQVCHASTSVWSADGSVADAATHTGDGDTYCVGCHIPTEGFKAESAFSDHNVTINGGCEGCHGPLTNHAEIEALHNPNGTGACAICHASTRQNVIDAIATGSATCLDCHAEPTIHQQVYYDTDQVDMPLKALEANGDILWQKANLPFGKIAP